MESYKIFFKKNRICKNQYFYLLQIHEGTIQSGNLIYQFINNNLVKVEAQD